LVKDKAILEFGAGAGLPSLVCATKGARKVVVTDYPDEELVENLRYNIEHSAVSTLDNIVAEGYLWGNSPSSLTAHLGSSDDEGFDLLILADVLFNHSEHRKLVVSVQKTLKRTAHAKALVFFTPHRPWLFDKDMAFFELAKEVGLVVEKVLEKKLEKAMIQRGPVRRSIHDIGDEEIRKVVFGYELRWIDL
jgi:EEF1A N-terminal glycine/lysine methyltransferase